MRSRAFGLVLLLLFVMGCGGPKEPPAGMVSGKVTMNGKPVNGGEILFSAGGRNQRAVIGKDSSYIAAGVPAGKVTVAVTAPRGVLVGGKQAMIPPKYNKGETSGLTVEIKANEENKFDINLN